MARRGFPADGRPRSGDLRVGSGNPPLNGELKIAHSDIRPLMRDQLTLLRGELRAALTRGVANRTTHMHLEDARVRIARPWTPEPPPPIRRRFEGPCTR